MTIIFRHSGNKYWGNHLVRPTDKIIIEGGGNSPGAAISIVGSKNVLIENNTIIGTKTLFKIWDEDADQKSNVIEQGNIFEEGGFKSEVQHPWFQ